MTTRPTQCLSDLNVHYDSILGDISQVIEAARRSAARSVNSVMTSAYWLIGRRIVEFEQKGEQRAAYGEELLGRLSGDLSLRYGRGFSRQNLQQMRQFYLLYPSKQICQTPSGILHAASIELLSGDLAGSFPLLWSDFQTRLWQRNIEQACLLKRNWLQKSSAHARFWREEGAFYYLRLGNMQEQGEIGNDRRRPCLRKSSKSRTLDAFGIMRPKGDVSFRKFGLSAVANARIVK